MTTVRYTERDAVGILTLNRPQAKNAFNGPMMDALRDRVESLESRTDLLAIILTSEGSDSFCAGGDLRWLQRLDSPEQGRLMGQRMQETLDRLSRLTIPVIGVLNGYAIGGGAELALACDFRVMESHSFLHFKQVRVGLITGWGGGPRLLRALGYARSVDILLTCPKIDPQRAKDLGLCNEIAERGQGIESAWRIIEQLRRGSPSALRTMKDLLQKCDDDDQHTGMIVENQLFATLWDGEDHREAQAAFSEKRCPRFTGDAVSDTDE